MTFKAITHILFVAFFAMIPLNATSVSQIIAEVENEVSGKSGALGVDPGTAVDGQKKAEKNGHCRGQLRTRFGQCKTENCKKSAFTEFKFCTVSNAKINRVHMQKQAFVKAEKLRQQAIKPDACMSILRKRDVCATDEKCRSHLWKEYQACLNKFSKDDDKPMSPEKGEKLSPNELREHEISLKRMEYEADVARAALEKQMNEKKNRKLRKELSKKKRKLTQLKRKHKKYGGDPTNVPHVRSSKKQHTKVTSPTVPVKLTTATVSLSAGENRASSCQTTLVRAIKKCQTVYQRNPLPRFDNTHIECVREAKSEASVCAVQAGIGAVAIPNDEELSMKSGDKIAKTPQDCDAMFAKDLEKKCGTDWSCRNKAQQKAWMCKALVSLPK